MITPTVGRKVHFWMNGAQGYGDVVQREQPLDVNVVYVWNDRMVNVAGFDANGDPFKVTSCTFLQEGDQAIPGGQCYVEWMPYQKGQAAKTEALAMLMAFGDVA